MHINQKNKVIKFGKTERISAVLAVKSFETQQCPRVADTVVYNLAKFVCTIGIVDLVQKR